MLQLEAEVEIRLFNVFFWERKRDSGFRRKKVRDAGFLRKKERECGIRNPPSRPSSKYLTLKFVSCITQCNTFKQG